MSTSNPFKTPSQAEIAHHIAVARKMRSDFIRQSAISGWSWVRALFSHTGKNAKASA